MLVLKRKKDEIVTIGDDIEIMVVEIRGGSVRLGIKAPSNKPIHRKDRATTGGESESTGKPHDA